MIKFNKIFAFVVMFVALCACERGTGSITPDDDNSVDVEMPKHGYIFFNMENLSTRAELFNGGVLEQNFSVLGYRYAKSTSWETQRTVASLGKTISYENNEGQVVESGEKMGVFGEPEPTVQLIEWNKDGRDVHSYSPLQEWQAALRYAFFAWYPATLTANDGRNTSSSIATNDYYVGRPFITYSIPEGTTKAVRQSMVDVMTACRIDYTKAIDGAYVGLKMKHRLAVLDIKAMSIVDAKSLKKYLTDNEQTANFADDATVMVNITNIRLKLSEIKKGAKFPLNTEKDSEGKVEPLEYSKKTDGTIDTYKDIEYTGFNGATGDNAIPYFQKESDIKELVGADEKLILIPQPETIKATLSFDYEILCNGTKIDYVSGSHSGETDIEGLAEGVYHYLLITVAKSGVAVKAVVVQDSWDGKDKTIDHEFN